MRTSCSSTALVNWEVSRASAAVSTEEYLRHVAATNTSVWVTASAYGLDTARADAVASDLTLLASSGILGHSRIGDEWAPTVPPGDLGLKLTGYVMVVAALHAVHVRRVTGDVLHVDVSAQGSVIATGLTLEMAHALADCPDEGGSARYGAPSGFFSCVDGLIYVLVLEQHQWAAFRRALSPALDSVETLVQARDNTDHVNAQLASWAATRTAEECERILQGAGVPCTQINTLDILTDRAHAAGRSLDLSGPDAPMLPAQVRLVPTEDRRSTIGLADLRVLDAGHVLAVPLGAAWLGAMGATVTKLEDPQRLDIYRRRGPFAGGVPGVNRSAYFNQLNFNKTTLDLAVGSADAELDLDAFDVVLQNLMPRRARTVGADLDSVLAAGSSTGSAKLAISSSGFGGTGRMGRIPRVRAQHPRLRRPCRRDPRRQRRDGRHGNTVGRPAHQRRARRLGAWPGRWPPNAPPASEWTSPWPSSPPPRSLTCTASTLPRSTGRRR